MSYRGEVLYVNPAGQVISATVESPSERGAEKLVEQISHYYRSEGVRVLGTALRTVCDACGEFSLVGRKCRRCGGMGR